MPLLPVSAVARRPRRHRRDPETHPPLPTPDQRKGGALPRHPARGMGPHPALADRPAAHQGLRRVHALLQSPPLPLGWSTPTDTLRRLSGATSPVSTTSGSDGRVSGRSRTPNAGSVVRSKDDRGVFGRHSVRHQSWRVNLTHRCVARVTQAPLRRHRCCRGAPAISLRLPCGRRSKALGGGYACYGSRSDTIERELRWLRVRTHRTWTPGWSFADVTAPQVGVQPGGQGW
jgi:hypothetical protein